MVTDVVEFQIGGGYYAIDVRIAREIVEMMSITPIPRAPSYISGVINLRGEVTNIINIREFIGIPDAEGENAQKIIVLMPEATGGSSVGIIVDDVKSVMQISPDCVEELGEGLSSDITCYVKGIIKIPEGDGEESTRLIIWIDMEKVIADILNN